MSSPDEPSDEREPHGELWVDRWILPALRELTLLPIVLVVVGHLVAVVAPAEWVAEAPWLAGSWLHPLPPRLR